MKSEVFNEDCMVGMARYPDKYFDLAIVDPPYGIGEDGRNNHTRGKLTASKDYTKNSRYDNAIPDALYFIELRRVSKNQIIWGGNYFIEHLNSTPCFIVWDKNNGETDFADCELAWASFKTAVRRYKYTWHGMLQQNMKDKEERIHPNHKPIALYKWLLHNYAKPGDKILDTHMGSQSSRIAAFNMGFDYTGFEIDAEYFNDGNKRFLEQTAQIQLFS
jgi:site-specific DNA-methyltransferase (adenine-specific)